jgi:hypothetical protein
MKIDPRQTMIMRICGEGFKIRLVTLIGNASSEPLSACLVSLCALSELVEFRP